jgi:hypothetical protein
MSTKKYRRWIDADAAARGMFDCPFQGRECSGSSCPLWLEHPHDDSRGTCTLSHPVEIEEVDDVHEVDDGNEEGGD